MQVIRWLDGMNSSPLCTIYGDPGIGKSSFAVQFAFSYSDRVAAILCFEHGNVHYNSPDAMIQVLAYQLACRITDYRKELLRIVQSVDVSKLHDNELFDQLLAKPLTIRHIDGGHETLCIVIDGLDECSQNDENTICDLLQTCIDRLPSWINVLVTSRRDAAVMDRLSPGTVLQISSKTQENLRDIEQYLDLHLSAIMPDPAERQATIASLAEKSSGIFLYAYLAVQGAKHQIFDIHDPGVIPPDLSAIIHQWFRRIFPDTAAYAQLFRKPIGAILASPVPIPVAELERLADLDAFDVRDLLSRLQVFTKQSISAFNCPSVSFEHRFIDEWLSNERSGRYFVSVRDSARMMGKHLLELCEDEPESLTEYECLYALDILRSTGSVRSLNAGMQNEALSDACKKYGFMCKKKGLRFQSEKLMYTHLTTQVCIWLARSHAQELCVIKGSAGIGKTTFAGSLCKERGVLYCSHAFDGNDFMAEISRQIIGRLEAGGIGNSAPQGDHACAFHKLLSSYHDESNLFGRVLIIMDNDPSDELIRDVLRICPDWVRILIMSRTIPSIQDRHVICMDDLLRFSTDEIISLLHSENLPVSDSLFQTIAHDLPDSPLAVREMIRFIRSGMPLSLILPSIHDLTDHGRSLQENRRYADAMMHYSAAISIASAALLSRRSEEEQQQLHDLIREASDLTDLCKRHSSDGQ